MKINDDRLEMRRVKVASPACMRKVDRSILLRLIRKHQPVSRAELARITSSFGVKFVAEHD
jgi:hypothetical protein